MIQPRTEIARRMADAAAAFLASLDDSQRELAAWPFPADEERRRWFYTPTDHGGLPVGAMRPAQQRLAFRLLAAALSRPGYVTVSTIVGLENVLDELEGWTVQFERERGRDPGLYYLRVFGEPSADGTWSWRFGGHHVSLNNLIVDGQLEAWTPLFLGADPASSPLLGPHPLRPLAGVEDLARELVHALDPEQRAAAVLSPAPPVDLVGANRPRVEDGDRPAALIDVWRAPFRGELGDRMRATQERAERTVGLQAEHLAAVSFTSTPKGVAAHALTDAQRELLRALLDVYVRRVPDALADAEAAKYEGARIEALHFAWAGGIEVGEPHYYRIQGPRLLAEYDNTQRSVNHVHSVWRDPDGDFGDDVLARHYQEAAPGHGHT
jgi:Protein of unknown function (DUF3500)